MEKKEYILLAIKERLPLKRLWMRLIFSIPKSKNDLINLEDGKYYVTIGNKREVIDDANPTEPLFNIEDKIKAPKDIVRQLENDIETTVGNLIINYIIGDYGINGKIPYINSQFSFEEIHKKYIVPNLVNNGEERKPTDITIEEYKHLGRVMAYLRGLTNAIVTVSTPETFYPPEGLKEKKKEVFKKFKDKYGDGWEENPIYVIEFENELMAWVKDKLKDDPTYGITMTGKVLNSSFKKKYISLGISSKMSESDKSKNILTSLYESYPEDKEAIATIFNSIRYGSAARGLETVEAGVDAKQLIRATHGFKIVDDDCGTKDTVSFKIMEEFVTILPSIYIKENGKSVLKDEKWYRSNIGKIVQLRLPMYCKSKGERFCKKCVGTELSTSTNGLGLLAVGLGGLGLQHSLSKFHGVGYELKKISIDEFIRL